MDPTAPRMPPRFVPVLTEIVPPDDVPSVAQADAAPGWAPAAPAAPARTSAALEGLDDQLIHRVMQRVDVALEQQLHDAVATMVLQHTQSLVPRLREEIEFVVRQAVSQAVAAELAARQPG